MSPNTIMLIVWVVVAVAFFIGEMATAGFALMWFGIGAVVGALFAFLKLPIWSQLLAVTVVSFVLFALSRVFFKKITKGAPQEGIAGDRMIGKTGIVIESINMLTSKGLVRVEHEEWRAQCIEGYDDKPIEVGSKVKVVRIEGVRLIVKPKEE